MTFANFARTTAHTATSGGDIGKSVLNQGINLAIGGASNLLRDLGRSIFNFSEGGIADDMMKPGPLVDNFMDGGIAGGYSISQINKALSDEGPDAILAAVHKGERLISRKNGDAAVFQSMLDDGTWAERKANKSAQVVAYSVGGTAGNSPGISSRSGSRMASGPVYNDNSMTINVQSDRTDVRDQIGYSQDQLELRRQRALARNQNT